MTIPNPAIKTRNNFRCVMRGGGMNLQYRAPEAMHISPQ
jgi:hypothetical protein